MEQRSTWTDERLDDLSARMDAGFERVDRSFERVDRDIRDLRTDIQAMNQTMIRMGGGMFIGFISILAAIVART